MIRSIGILLCVLIPIPVAAHGPVFRSADGNWYQVEDSNGGPALRQVRLIRLGDGPDDPDDPDGPDDPGDRFGLISLSRDAASTIDYRGRHLHARMLAAGYIATAMKVQSGDVPQERLAVILEDLREQLLGDKLEEWNSWTLVTTSEMNDLAESGKIESRQDAAQALRDVAEGLLQTVSSDLVGETEDGERLGDGEILRQLIEFIIEFVLPIILERWIGG